MQNHFFWWAKIQFPSAKNHYNYDKKYFKCVLGCNSNGRTTTTDNSEPLPEKAHFSTKYCKVYTVDGGISHRWFVNSPLGVKTLLYYLVEI